MKEYKVTSENATLFNLAINDREIGRLIYKKWSSFKAEVILHTIQYFQLEPKGFWQTSIQLKKEDKVLLNYKMKWKGHIVIHGLFDETNKNFVFKQKGFLKSTYMLQDETGAEMLVIQPKFKWSNFNYDYIISTTDDFDTFKYAEVLLLTTIHIVNYYRSMVTSR